MRRCVLRHSNRVQLFATPWTITLQDPLSMGFFQQECCSGLPISPPRDLPDPRTELAFPAQVGRFFITGPPGKPL